MARRVIPALYTEPPSFDIELHDFLDLPLRRLEVFRLLHYAGKATKEGATSSHEDTGGADETEQTFDRQTYSPYRILSLAP